MRRDAFTGGVDPGGLWVQNDIRILICYILDSVQAPLSQEDLSRIVQGRGLANYFETGDALAALEKLGHVRREEAGFTVTETGREIAARLDAELPVAVRDKALEAALLLLAEARARREHRVEVEEQPNGCQVTCRIGGGGDRDLLRVSLYVPDRAQAQLAEERFYQNPDRVYRLVLAALTGDLEYAEELLR
jgi:hypothetical protein